jgi:RNA polymerase sigma-70 factor (ECF subfamily)
LGVPETLLEDGVQDVFLIVHRQQGKFEGRSTIKTWVVGIAVRVAKGYRRAEGRRIHRVEHLAAWFASDADAADSPSDAAERREASDVMHALLANLPDELREVLVLVELEELTIREACDAIGIRLRTGQRRLRAAVEALSSAVADFLAADWRSHP